MNLSDIRGLYSSSLKINKFVELLKDKDVTFISLRGLVASSSSLVFSSLVDKYSDILLFVLSDSDSAGYFYQDLVHIIGQKDVAYFPSTYRRSVKYGQKDAANEVMRAETVLKMTERRDTTGAGMLYVVTYPEAMAEMVALKQFVSDNVIKVGVGDRLDLTDFVIRLRELGFKEVEYVYEPGQFATRGSIVDIYSYSSEFPFRIDFFGDEVDTVRTFDVGNQLSREKCDVVSIVPPDSKDVESGRAPLTHFLSKDSHIVFEDYEYVYDQISKIYDEGFSQQAITEALENATEIQKEELLIQYKRENVLCPPYKFADECSKYRHVYIEKNTEAFETQRVCAANKGKSASLSFMVSPQPLFHKNFSLLKSYIQDYVCQGFNIYILADNTRQHQRLNDILQETSSDIERAPHNMQRSELSFIPVDKTLHEGFVDNDLKACFLTDHQIFDRFHKYQLKTENASNGKMVLTMKALREMNYGDYIVHIDFGVGKFGGLVRVPTEKGWQEVIRIIYKNNDIVDVSIHSLYKISKYRNSETGEPPALSVLGTGAWNRLKERTKKHIKDIARDLIKLYAKRRKEKGYQYSPDDYMQHELEASFAYEDTPDQLKATQDVKSDMESMRPMDRLICGDVGFGKTEIAVRAAFKAACNSKQTAVLVPTTILAFQHFQTFRDRLKNFPVRVEYLSRARTAKQVSAILADLESGRIDIIIGTHKLIGKNVKWHDLGLLIIDEEQKFGVATKEKLRKLKSNVDTLTMSATPIPRTLQFSLMGARDMSIIRTPPPNRYPIQTVLTTYNRDVIVDAINFEMSRNGQVFFVSNRINGLPEIAAMIKKYIPDCRIAIGHGRMKSEELETIIMDFINYDYDVLLSTTIVESGVDIPNTNTIIINDAQHFGLSDLHQMRGRVGRGNKKAFCFLLAPPKSVLSVDARRRLEALETFSDLGGGFSIAMQDLDIRGAGNLLGSEQSGFIEDLGYETYQKILSQAITELKNDEFSDMYADEMASGKLVGGEEFVDDCAIESDLEMFFPDTYVPGSNERIMLYRELDNITDDDALERFRMHMVDRFGPMPPQGDELLHVVPLRRIGKSLGCEKIILRNGVMTLQFVSNDESAYYRSSSFGHILNYISTNPRSCKLKEVNKKRLLTMAAVASVEKAVELLRKIKQSE